MLSRFTLIDGNIVQSETGEFINFTDHVKVVCRIDPAPISSVKTEKDEVTMRRINLSDCY